MRNQLAAAAIAIEARRKKLKLTQTAAAAKAGVIPNKWSRAVTDEERRTLPFLQRMADAVGLEIIPKLTVRIKK